MDKVWGFKTENDIPDYEVLKVLSKKFEGVSLFEMCVVLDKMKKCKKKNK